MAPSDYVLLTLFQVTSLGGKSITKYPARRKFLAISPAENPDNSTKLFLEDGLVLEKNSYVTTVTQYTLSWEMLKPFWNHQSNKQYRLKADSQVALLKYADLSLLPIVSELVVDIVPVPSTAALSPLPPDRRLLAPLSGNAVRGYETDIEHHAGFSFLPSRQEAQAFSTRHDPTLPQSATYPAWVDEFTYWQNTRRHIQQPSSTRHNPTLPQPATHPAWINNFNYSSRNVSYWQNTPQHAQQPSIRGNSSRPLRSPFNERSALLFPDSNQQLPHDEPSESEPVKTGSSSWFTESGFLLAMLGVVVIGYFSFVRK